MAGLRSALIKAPSVYRAPRNSGRGLQSTRETLAGVYRAPEKLSQGFAKYPRNSGLVEASEWLAECPESSGLERDQRVDDDVNDDDDDEAADDDDDPLWPRIL